MENSIIIIGIVAVLALVAIVSLFLSAPKSKKQTVKQQSKENEPVEEKQRPSVSRQMYNAMQRAKEKERKTSEEIEHKKRMTEEREKELENKKASIFNDARANDNKHRENILNEFEERLATKKGRVDLAEETVNFHKEILGHEKDKIEFEREKLAFDQQKQMFSLKIQTQLSKFAIEKQRFQLVQFFWKQFNTLDKEKISMAMERNKLQKQAFDNYTQKANLQIAKEWEKIERKGWEIDMKNLQSDMKVQKNDLHIKQQQFDYLEHRIFKDYGYESFQNYFQSWDRWDDKARKYGYANAERFTDDMLMYDNFAQLKEYQNKYLALASGQET